MKLQRSHRYRVPGTRTGPIIISLTFALIFGGSFWISVSSFGWGITEECIAVGLVLWILRACRMGILTSDQGITVRSWLFTRTYTFDRIFGYNTEGYSGTLNVFTQISIDPFYRRTRMLTLKVDGRWKEFPSTICSLPTAKRIRDDVAGRLRVYEKVDRG